MKTFRSFLTGIFLLCCSVMQAEVIDGINYSLSSSSKTASVISRTEKYSGDIVLPETVEYNGVTYSVTSIEFSAFSGCSGLTSVVIGNSVTSIGDQTFYDCSSLTSITIPNSVTSIGDQTFYNCSNLTAVHIEDIAAWCNIKFTNGYFNINSYTSNPLYYNGNLYLKGEKVTDLVIPNSVTSIGDQTFYGCSSLTSITIPNSVTSIGESAFSSCKSLTSVVIPNSVTSIGSYAFYDCSGLTSITIPNSVTIIGDQTFHGCI